MVLLRGKMQFTSGAICLVCSLALVALAEVGAAQEGVDETPGAAEEVPPGDGDEIRYPVDYPAYPVEPAPVPRVRAPRGRFYTSVAGGVFVPYHGSFGGDAMAQFLASSRSGRFRFGGEFEWRDYTAQFLGVDDVGIETYIFRGIFHYVFRPNRFTPYVGIGASLNVNDIDRDEVNAGLPFGEELEDSVGLGWGIDAIFGLEQPIGSVFVLFTEGRVGVAYQQITTEFGSGGVRTRNENLGGGTAILGARFKF